MTRKKQGRKFLTLLFYSLIGLTASLALLLTFYWNLRLNSSITSLINNTKTEPIYLWSYGVLTFVIVVLFGVNIALLVYRWRKFGLPKITKQAGSGLGALVGVAASACPVCGSVLLSAIGITAGLAAFPLQGLELKALALVLIALPLYFTVKDIKTGACENGVCPIPRNPSFKTKDTPWLAASISLIVILIFSSWNMLKYDPIVANFLSKSAKPAGINISSPYDKVAARVLPEQGFQSKIFLGDSIGRLIYYGVIDRGKFEAIYTQNGRLPPEIATLFYGPSYTPILLTHQNADYYVNLLWPTGLANYMSANRESPINDKSLFDFASTGGWKLGRAENGGFYFNKFPIVPLTQEQEARVTKIAKSTYRPCCDNPTFYQDCNHGSALLGLLELGVSQGLTEDELYKEALAFNSFWFPHTYIQTALYLKVAKNTDWNRVDPKLALGSDYSTINGWRKNIQNNITKIPNLVTQRMVGSRCGI